MLQVVYRVGRACALVVAVVALSGAGATGAWDERFETFASGAALEVYPSVREAIDLALAYAEFDQSDQARVHARAARSFYERTRDAQGQRAMERFAREWDLALDDDVQAEQQASR